MAESGANSRRRGRPPIPEAERKRHTLSFRLTSETKDALEHRAARNGRSLSEEAEWIISTDLFGDIPRINHLEHEIECEEKKRYNKVIDTINNCSSFQNLISRFASKLIDLDGDVADPAIHPYIRAFFQVIQISRSKTLEIEWEAVRERNALMLAIYETLRPKSSVGADDISRLYEGREIQLRDYMIEVLNELGVGTAE